MKTQNLTATHDPLDQMGRHLAHALTRHSGDLSHDVSERLRFARQQALAARKPEMASSLLGMRQSNGSMTLAGPPSEGLNLWNILGSALPALGDALGRVVRIALAKRPAQRVRAALAHARFAAAGHAHHHDGSRLER